jgi:hypothetical protein
LSSPEREVSEYTPLNKQLKAAGIDFVVIGGQACKGYDRRDPSLDRAKIGNEQ